MEKDDIRITLARKPAELKQILTLQKANLRDVVGEKAAGEQGYLTAVHDLATLSEMNGTTAAAIAKEGREVVGYALSMTRPFAEKIPSLTEVWAIQDRATFNGQLLGKINYLGMGQVCVAEHARGQKLVDRMYRYLRTCYSLHYPYLVTSIVTDNTRSLRVHERIGFKRLLTETDAAGREWAVVGWDWVR